ncbi:MAG: hypothetical protein M0005_06990 [Actinomycetota bacterium]|nr:hypothetical protein [Actinomycetota bacterium]
MSQAQARPPVGSPTNPRVFSCADESSIYPQVQQRPAAGDLVIGPLLIPGAKRSATGSPSSHPAYRDHGVTGYKVGFVPLQMGSMVTVTVGAKARSRVVLDPEFLAGGVVAATFRSWSREPGFSFFFPQIIAFTNGRTRGCVPLTVRGGDQARAYHATLSLFAGRC